MGTRSTGPDQTHLGSPEKLSARKSRKTVARSKEPLTVRVARARVRRVGLHGFRMRFAEKFTKQQLRILGNSFSASEKRQRVLPSREFGQWLRHDA